MLNGRCMLTGSIIQYPYYQTLIAAIAWWFLMIQIYKLIKLKCTVEDIEIKLKCTFQPCSSYLGFLCYINIRFILISSRVFALCIIP